HSLVSQKDYPTDFRICKTGRLFIAYGVNYISPLAEVLTVHKTITAVQSTRAIREAVRLILSARKC
ncbi:hypothetical protein AALD22_27420, partial [Lachnospiraceae bacterium 56-18]